MNFNIFLDMRINTGNYYTNIHIHEMSITVCNDSFYAQPHTPRKKKAWMNLSHITMQNLVEPLNLQVSVWFPKALSAPYIVSVAF